LKELAVFTRIYNEQIMFPLWQKHYGEMVGYDNIFVYDHGSEIEYDVLTPNYIKEDRTAYCDIERVKILERIQNELLKIYKFVIYADCDEFILPRPTKYRDIRAFIQAHDASAYRCVGIDVMPTREQTAPVDWREPVLRQRPYGALRTWSCKTLLSSIPLHWQVGLHQCAPDLPINPDLWLFHLKHADLNNLLQRLSLTRSIQWSEASLKAQLGSSHRIPDSGMAGLVNAFQASKIDVSLDRLDFQAVLAGPHPQSRLMQIPDEFLDSL
jgi:hypothetical protein